MLAQNKFNLRLAQLFERRLQIIHRFKVRHGDPRALFQEPARHAQTAAVQTQTHDEDALVVQIHFYNNANATPNIAASKPTSQKRCTTCISLQPKSKK